MVYETLDFNISLFPTIQALGPVDLVTICASDKANIDLTTEPRKQKTDGK